MLDESKNVSMPIKNRRKSSWLWFNYTLRLQKIELAQTTLDSKMVEYEGKKKLLITQYFNRN